MDTDQLKPFDLEKAKAGKPIVTHAGSPVKFVGVMSNGGIAVEVGEGKAAYAIDLLPQMLRMLPEVKKVKALLYRNNYGEVKIMADVVENRTWAKTYHATIIKEFEIEYEDE